MGPEDDIFWCFRRRFRVPLLFLAFPRFYSHYRESPDEYTSSPVEAYANVAWDVADIESSPITFDLRSLYSHGFPNRVIFLQNAFDGLHRDRHLAPWLRATPEPDNNMWLLMGRWGRGHTPPDSALLKQVLEASISPSTSSLEELGFEQAPPRNRPKTWYQALKQAGSAS